MEITRLYDLLCFIPKIALVPRYKNYREKDQMGEGF